MKNRIITMVIVLASVSAFAQYRAVEAQGEMMIEGRPFMTDGSRYNSYYMGGSPLGRFDMDTAGRLDAIAGFRSYSLGGENGTFLQAPTLIMGEPGRAFFELFYRPDIMSRDGNADTASSSASIHRFGLTIAGQAGTGFFRAALSAEGFLGKQEWDGSDTVKTFMGFEKIRIDMGAAPHPLLRVGFFIDATLHYDSLRIPNQDPTVFRGYSVQSNLPEIGGNIDFGGEDMPVRSNLSFSHAWSRLVYGVRGPGVPQNSEPAYINSRGDAYAIRTDSTSLFWLTQARIPLADDQYVVKPALLVGYTNNSGRQHIPHEENDPLKISDEVPDRNYDLYGFQFGVGAGAEILKYADLHVEYSLASMSLGCGERFPQPTTDKRMLHHITLGASSPINKYVDIPAVEITPRIAYFVSGSAGIIPPRHSSLAPFNNNVTRRYMDNLYEPQKFLEGFARTSGFTIGVDGSALENMFSFSGWMTLLNKTAGDAKDGGLELGLSLGLSL